MNRSERMRALTLAAASLPTEAERIAADAVEEARSTLAATIERRGRIVARAGDGDDERRRRLILHREKQARKKMARSER